MSLTLPGSLSPAGRPSGPADEQPLTARLQRLLSRHDGYVALLAYLLISLLWYRSVIVHMGRNCACGLRVDPADNADTVWWLEWFVQAIGNGLPLLHPTAIWAPTGINMAGSTASLLMAFTAAPLTLLWGPVQAYNVLMILAPAASGWAAERLCRHLTTSPAAALIGGATYGFSSFEVGQLVGHAHLVWMLVPPLVALCVIRLLDGTLGRRKFVTYTSLLVIAQIMLSVEVAFTMTLVGLLWLGAAWLSGTQQQRRVLLRGMRVVALPWLIAGLVTSAYTVQVLTAPAFATGIGARYPTDLLAFIVPMRFTWLGGSALGGFSDRFAGGWNETDAYLGIPMLLIVGRYLYTQRQERTTKALAILLAALVCWILGPVLWIAGRPGLWLPYRLLTGLPLLDETMQGRIAMYLALSAAVTLALWLAIPRGGGLRLLGWGCGALVVVSLLPNIASPSVHNVGSWMQPRFFSTDEYSRYLHRGETILPIPWGYQTESYAWQAEDHMYWKQASGNWLFLPPPGWANALTMDLWNNVAPHTGDAAIMHRFLLVRHISDVIVLDPYVRRWRRTLTTAGLRPVVHTGGVTVYRA